MTEISAHANIAESRVLVSELADHVGEVVLLAGWVSVARKQKAVQFVVIRDRSGEVQLVNERESSPGIAEVIDGLHQDSVVVAQGRVEKNERVRLGGIEVKLESLEVLSQAEDLPLNNNSSLDVRLDWRFIDLRSPRNQLLFRVQTLVEEIFRGFCIDSGFVEINSPKLMASPSESRSELFEVKYFDRSAYLAQSPQFYKQMGIASGFDGVFETGPVFRANPSFTSRHDTEFTSVDVEFAWVSSHEDVMRFEERLLAQVLGGVKERFGSQIEELFGVEVVVPSLPFPRIAHSEAISAVERTGYRIPRADGDLDPEAERRLAAAIAESQNHEFVFVTDYPSSVRPFYHMRHEADPSLTKSFDLIWKGLEITTGAQREHRYSELHRQVLEKGLEPEGLSFYLDFFRFGCPPHGGFGLGLTRVLMILLGLSNVREATYLYRGPNRLTP